MQDNLGPIETAHLLKHLFYELTKEKTGKVMTSVAVTGPDEEEEEDW